MKKNYFKFEVLKTISFLIILLLSLNTFGQTYTSATTLKAAVTASTTGGTFILKNGTYNNFSISFEKVATSENPIIVKAETVGGVTLTGKSNFAFKKSAYITLEGFVFDATEVGSLIKLEGSHHIRVTRNVFEQTTSTSAKWVYIGGVYDDVTIPYQFLSHDNRIDHNIFQNKATPGHYITIDGTNETEQSQYDRIDHNYFKNNSPRAVNEQESIRIGWSEMSKSSGFTTVEFNLFEDCDGDPEIVSVKSSDNIIRHNTFIKSYGTLSLRHGNRNRVEGNYFFGGNKAIGTSPDNATLYTGGIRVYGKDHVIINNYMQGLNGTKWDAPITLTLGDAIDGSSSDLTKHFRPENVLIAYNTLVDNSNGIEIGFSNNGSYSKSVENITIANNLITGSVNSLVAIKDNNDQGSKISWINNLFYPTETATVITGNTSTNFTSAMVVNQNPNLTFDSVENIWRSTETTPIYLNAVTTESISDDIEGQSRTIASNPGADHFSTESIRYHYLKPVDVGPNAYETDDNSESLYLSSISNFDATESTQAVTVTSNVDWAVTSDNAWLTASPATGSNTGTFNISVSANTAFTTRTGILTVTGGNLTRSLNITQAAADPKSNLSLINDKSVNDKVVVFSVFHEEITDTKNNIATNSLDKNFSTQWSGNGVGGEIVYDLGGAYDLELVDFASTNGKTYKLQIWVSTTGTEVSDFTNAFPSSGDLISNSDGTFKSFILPTVATAVKYVKIIGNGQASSTWNTITEIEFYKTKTLSVKNDALTDEFIVYPNPTSNQLNIKIGNRAISQIQLFNVNGRKVLENKINTQKSEINVDVSKLAKGAYFVIISDNNNSKTTKTVLIN
ncbi:chondroitinase-B domain-containing protein [uncultured Polaribacter sp.]|uniref:chondroitinase-B domain-containing protein n=1 Tax=uncultured Polaribacter sp. TaxID=174711 RepID=UPI0030DA93F6|tara:strand:- start:322 stop:2862 length:2541 start_codon:yes stop_codon:yes gene_type:complete